MTTVAIWLAIAAALTATTAGLKNSEPNGRQFVAPGDATPQTIFDVAPQNARPGDARPQTNLNVAPVELKPQTSSNMEPGNTRAQCPCVFSGSSLDCTYLHLKAVPTACFSLYHPITQADFDFNDITEILEHDLEDLAETVLKISFNYNSLYYIHPWAFKNFTVLEWIELSVNNLQHLPEHLLSNSPNLHFINICYNKLVNLPISVFSSNFSNIHGFEIYIEPNPFLSSIPCSFLAPVETVDYLAINIPFWAKTEKEASACKSFSYPITVSHCQPFGSTGLDCSTLTEPLTPQKASMALTEGKMYPTATKLVFRVELGPLRILALESMQCLPLGIDMAQTYMLYSRHTADLVIESLFFDLLDLPRYTSSNTHSVEIYADTVVLTGPLNPLTFQLTIVARQVSLEWPVLVSVELSLHQPNTHPDFFSAIRERGRVAGIVAERLRHGPVTMVVLKADEDPTDECQQLPDWTSDAEAWVKSSQLSLSLHCANAVLEGGKVEHSQFALDILDFLQDLTTEWTSPAFVGINQRAIKSEQMEKLRQEGREPLRVVPYMTVPVYSDMVSYLTENSKLYKEAMDQLKLKLEVNAQRMFDMSIGFTERKADLKVIQDNAVMAVDKAKETLGAHQNQLENLYQQTNSLWKAVNSTYDEVMESRKKVDAAQERVKKGMESYKRRRRFVSLLNLASLTAGLVKGLNNTILGMNFTAMKNMTKHEIINAIVEPVGDFLILFNKHDITRLLENIGDTMEATYQVLNKAPTIPPSPDEIALWLQEFKDTEQLVQVATNQSLAQTQWEKVRQMLQIILDDEELSDAVDGVRQLKMEMYDFTVYSQALNQHLTIFSSLVIMINQQASVVEDDKAAVETSQEGLESALELLDDSLMTEDNYLSYMVQQNVALGRLMLQLYLKSRTDLLATFNILSEYCDAYFFTFLNDCPVTASYWDDYNTMFYKMNQLDVLALDAVGSLDPPPQPFTMTFFVADNDECIEVTDPNCPITQLKHTGKTSLILSNWWGPELQYTDRVRIDRIQIYLVGLLEPQVTVSITRPLMFNDTWHGEQYHFTGHITTCLIIYSDETFSGLHDAYYITDCSTDHHFEQYYYRSTPYGEFQLEWSSYKVGTNYTRLQAVQVLVEGSWIPRI